MKKCSFFSQNRKLVAIVVRGAYFIVEERLFYYQSTFLFVYPSSSSGWRYGMNGNSDSCRQPNWN